jgi:hypothetical protein
MATLYRVEAKLAGRIAVLQYLCRLEGLETDITEGFRPYAEQKRLRVAYETWQSALVKHSTAAKAQAAGYEPANLAAMPGYSNHGRIINWKTLEQADASAVDLALRKPTAANIKRFGKLARQCGLKQTVRGEYWHLELDPTWKGELPKIEVGKAKPSPAVEEDDMQPFVKRVEWNDGALAYLMPDGNVYCPEGLPGRPTAKHWGGMSDLRDDAKRTYNGQPADLIPINLDDSQAGYTILDTGFEDHFDFMHGVEKFFKK